MKGLPIGIQSFTNLRNGNYLYVDKTQDIHRLITSGRYFFLSRPRRFGKSLLISTLEAIFQGKKELFEGLWMEDKMDWAKLNHPVIRIDFGGMNNRSPEGLTDSLNDFIKTTASEHNINIENTQLPGRFAELITKLHRSSGYQTVVLIDEYDKAIIDNMSEPEVMESNKQVLHDFYQVLKASDDHLHFVFLTGVSKFSGVSIFSGLNNLNDITLDTKYATICGYTQQELENDFSEYLEETSQQLSMSKTEVLNRISIWYNIYSLDAKTSIYDPFSTLLVFENKEFGNY
jgi:hypothetical protein